MDKPDLIVKEVRSQYGVKNLQGRPVKPDVYAVDHDGKNYNIEIQRDNQQAGPKRARYNGSLIDANAILPGEDVEQLPETYIILITETDYFGKGKPIYHIEKYVEETNEVFDDGSHIIYVNGAYKDESALGKLIHDFNCTNPADMNYPILADRVRYFKEDKEGLSKMSRATEELFEELFEERIEEERKELSLKFAKNLLKSGHSLQEVANYLEITIDEVKKLTDLQTV